MTRIERRVLTNCVLAGTLLTSIVVLAELLGWLQVPENLMYDLRARHFQFFQKPPTDQLVHLDIDDRAIDVIGPWPWPRTQMALIIDEVHLAGAKAVGLDIIYVDPQPPSYVEVSTALPATQPTTNPILRQIDHDALLSDAIRRAGNVILPGSLILAPPSGDTFDSAVRQELAGDIELSEAEVSSRLHDKFPRDLAKSGRLEKVFYDARRLAVYDRLTAELSTGPKSVDQLRQRLIKRQDVSVNSPLSRILDEQLTKYQSDAQLRRFGVTPPIGGEPFIPAMLNYAPIERLGEAMAGTAFVDFKSSRDGVLRTQPLVLECNGRLYPQFGFSVALLYLGATLNDVTFTSDTVTVACPNGRRIQIPVSVVYSDSLGRNAPTIFQIPWFGRRDWETMYDWPDHRNSKQHLSMNTVADIGLTREKIARNNANVDKALPILVDYMTILNNTPRLPPQPPTGDQDALSRMPRIERMLSVLNDRYEFDASLSDQDLTDEERPFAHAMKAAHDKDYTDPKFTENERLFINAVKTIENVRRENLQFKQQLDSQIKSLRDQVNGKAVLVGFTATGNQDAVPTSMHGSCPGVVTHGAIFNAIVSNHFWRVAPEWITVAFAISLGLITAAVAWRFSPLRAFWITTALGIGYVLLNGLLFLDHLGQIIGLAAPQIAMAAVWSGCSLARIVIESSERARITKRFTSYVDPTLVNYVMERPDDDGLAGETRELTVCFSDMAGFTSLSERLGERIVPLLKEFMGRMVPIIRQQNGYIDKFLGDGIMYFFGAPEPNPNHAAAAVETALLMQQAIIPFNEELIAKGLPTVKVRIGINTGTMVVGDAGSSDAADYTVIGDNVNFASRLESANKQLGTLILISARTAELIGDRFLLRPVGALQVVGKTESVLAYEVCGLADSATPLQRRQCEQTHLMVKHFRGRSFKEAMTLADDLDSAFGASPLTDLYRDLCAVYLADAPAEPFDGKIVFKDK